MQFEISSFCGLQKKRISIAGKQEMQHGKNKCQVENQVLKKTIVCTKLGNEMSLRYIFGSHDSTFKPYTSDTWSQL